MAMPDASAGTGWQPIETVPQDGRTVLLWWTSIRRVRIARYLQDHQQWFFGELAMHPSAIPTENISDLARYHSHWMEYPEAPQ